MISMGRIMIVAFVVTTTTSACLVTTDFDVLRSKTGSGPSDAAQDAVDDARVVQDSTPSSGCVGATIPFCEDFDQGLLTDGWTTTETTNGGMVSLDTTRSLSGGGSFRARTPALDGTSVSSAKARLKKEFGISTSGARLAFGVYVAEVSANAEASATASLEFNVGDAYYTTYLLLRSSGDEFLEYLSDKGIGNSVQRVPLLPPLPRRGWVHVEMDVSLTSRTATIRVDSRTVADVTLAPPYMSGAVVLRMGASVDHAAAPFDVFIDDVQLRFP